MKKNLKKALLVSSLLAFPLVTLANSIPIKVLPAITANNLPNEKILTAVKNTIHFAPDILSARVQVIFNNANIPDHLLVYSFSSKTYHLTISKIAVDKDFKPLSVTANYHLQKQDLDQQPYKKIKLNELKCPDESVEIFSGTAFDNFPTARDVVLNITQKAIENNYKAANVLGDQATTENYLNYLSCPNLKGYFNVGAGDEAEFAVFDGVINYEDLKNNFTDKLNHVVVEFNSGFSYLNPLKTTLTETAKAQKYVGGATALFIGPSEATSLCFWADALKGKEMTPALADCNDIYDPNDRFGIDGHGDDVLLKPQTLKFKMQ